VTVLGADVDVDNKVGTAHLSRLVAEVSETWGKSAIEIRTDLRRVFNGLIGWEEFHGSALAAIRHLLADHIGTQLIASTAGDTSWKRGWGSHPALDPLYGTDSAPIVHHGLVGRADKILALTAAHLALQNLKVCFKKADGTNCGQCQKCIFAIEALDLFGALDRAPTFPFKPGRLKLRCTGDGNEGDLINLLDHCRLSGRRPDLQADIDRALRTYRRYKPARNVVHRGQRALKQIKRRLRLEYLGKLKSHPLPVSAGTDIRR
jgi:hypothetical protein